MTEPDEALLWAREQSALPAVQTVTAQAYRAGAAASAARIKALEEALRAANLRTRLGNHSNWSSPLAKRADQ